MFNHPVWAVAATIANPPKELNNLSEPNAGLRPPTRVTLYLDNIGLHSTPSPSKSPRFSLRFNLPNYPLAFSSLPDGFDWPFVLLPLQLEDHFFVLPLTVNILYNTILL